ncbi:HD domain-containing protein [Streptomyces eurocidicus]|uniref:ATP-binding protein n=1 Tax=Streptomyces eurocidicus TaxID=66423 RepID=A0A7W8BE19_STREU|nr:hypothetical protein [Streptomyces eurocidicus]MBB5119744.1 hypothetical protein [Streptomyces eurocidicus]MBF6050767.1 hypothetical protein [Streptomyces eurocidicus]
MNLFLSALHRLAQANRPHPPVRLPSQQQWYDMAREAKDARHKKTAALAIPAPSAPRTPTSQLGWEGEVAGSQAWHLMKPGSEDLAEALKQQATEVVGRLAELYDDARPALADDPWHDKNLARRIADRTNQLSRMIWPDGQSDLSPAEATLLALLPFLYQTHRSRTAAGLSHVEPTNLAQSASCDRERRSYEVLLRGHEPLIRQGERGHLNDRPDGRREIGWWLFHQWANRQPGQLHSLRAAMNSEDTGIGAILDPELLHRLLSCVHATPHELYGAALEGHLRNDAFPLDLGGRGWQHVRERLLGLMFAIAHGLAIEVMDLSSAVVRHVGIPEPLDPGRLLDTVQNARWNLSGDVIGLRADCDHPAAVAALTEHTHRVESLLRAARRAAVRHLGRLPVYANADQVRETDTDGNPVGTVTRFRLDEERVQALLMGENLYRERGLAIRELYQNALDACRYRQVREQARNGRDYDGYPGRITFVQGVDENGRHFLQCRDNGIGMDETMLSEVFSRAGVRFTDLPQYAEERQEWQNQGITIHPNSRFGIGVLSYFMLADEIRVTTCHMDGAHGRLTEFSVLITGPGHYFRVRPSGRPGTIGTTVRLYLRDGDKAPSCVRELGRLLGIAEFRTTAEHGTQRAEWVPGVLRPRRDLGFEHDGFEADGRLVPWAAGPRGADGQVVWCESGGGVLVDGIFTEPRARCGVLADPADLRRLRGAVVNLTGESRPRRLSVDRSEILDDDIHTEVERLVKAALPTLLSADPPLVDAEWLADVSGLSPRLADIVTEAAGIAGHKLELHGHPSCVSTAGFFPQDVHIVHGTDSGSSEMAVFPGRTPAGTMYGDPDPATQLWRLLGQRPNDELAALTEIVPELARVTHVLPARPSDGLLRTACLHGWADRSWPNADFHRKEISTPGHALSIASFCGASYQEVVERMRQLRLPGPELPGGDTPIDAINLALLSRDLRGLTLNSGAGSPSWLDVNVPVPPGHLVNAHFVLDISVSDAAHRMRVFGFSVPEVDRLPQTPEVRTLRLLSVELNGKRPWLDPTRPVTIGQVLLAATELAQPVQEVVRELRSYGFRVEVGAAHERLADDLIRQGTEWGWEPADWRDLEGAKAVPPGVLASTSARLGIPLHKVASRLQKLGLGIPAPLPEQTDDADPLILSSDACGGRPWLPVGAEISLRHIAQAAVETGLPPAEVVSRLRAYGLLTPGNPLPASAERSDVTLLELDGESSQLPSDRPVSVRQVIRLSGRLGMSPQAVIDRLAQYGLATQLKAGPAQARAFDTALVRMASQRSFREQLLLDWDRPVPLHHMLSTPAKLLLDPQEVEERLRAFGFRIPEYDPDRLDDTDRNLCLRRHSLGNSGEGEDLPLGLSNPISDFLLIARLADIPVSELVPRLERLGVDLQRVIDAVRAALPDVPGLVREDPQTQDA